MFSTHLGETEANKMAYLNNVFQPPKCSHNVNTRGKKMEEMELDFTD